MLSESDQEISVPKDSNEGFKNQKVIKVKVLVSKKHEKSNTSSTKEMLKYQESIGRPHSCPNRPIMGTTALLTRAKSLNYEVGEVVQKIILGKYQSTLTYFSNRSFARRKTRKRKSTGNVFNSTSASDQSYATAISSHQTTIESYDADQFLKDALGDEIDAYASTLDIKDQDNDYSVSTCDISDLLGSFVSHDSKQTPKSINSYCSTPLPQRKSDDPRREAILQKLLVQEQIIQQISKVIDFCKNTKQFISSEEYIEAEKVLLLAMYKKEMLLNELMVALPEIVSVPISGYVRIKRLHFPSKINPCDSPVKRRKGFSYRYLCVVTCGNKILSSDVIGQSKDGSVLFNGNLFQLDNLEKDFEIKVTLYALIVKNNLKNYSEESKYHIDKETISCPTPAKLFHSPRRHNKPGKYSVNLPTVSSFSQWGNFTIRLSDLNKNTEYQMNHVPLRSTLQGIAKVEMDSGVVIKNKISGFVNMGIKTNKGTVSWNTFWCKLDDQFLKFWKYPSEEYENPACVTINLSDCDNYPLACASRETCPRPRTLLLETHSGLVTYFLSYDNLKDLQMWMECLNLVIIWCKK